MAPKKSTRVYALAAATVITAGTLSYVPATFASEAGSSTGSDTSATESTHENSSLPLQTIPWAKSSASAQPAGAQETASAASTQVPEQEKPVKSESPTASETASASTPEAKPSETSAVPEQTEKTSKATPGTKVIGVENEGDETSEGRQNAPKVSVDSATIYTDNEFSPFTVRVSGFYGPRVGSSIEVRIQEVNAQGRPVGAPLATGRVSAQELIDGTATATVNVSSSRLKGNKSYAIVAVSNPGGKDHLVAGTIVELKQRRVTHTVTSEAPAPQESSKKDASTAAPAQPENTQAPKPTETVTPKPQESSAAPAPSASADTGKSEASSASESASATPSSASAEASETASASPSATSSAPAPASPAEETTMDVANKASLRVDSAHFSGDAATNVVVVRGTGFTGEHVSEGVEVTIFELDSEGKAQGEAIKSVFVKPSEIVDGSFTAQLEVEAAKLRPGYSYGIVAISNPKGEEHVQAYTVAMVSDDSHPAPGGEDNNANVAATRPGAKKAGHNNGGQGGAAALNRSAEGDAVQAEPDANTGNAHSNSSSAATTSANKRNLARTGADGVVLFTTLGGSTLVAGTALVAARRRKKDNV
ncbi:LPXTG cell wall anchor domain-containing protein [Rothia dentocariosa]|uniref:LPXTG cell wall anchor domain-containing protein n=1 Tax=Rothia dentocariosa TaxID=2047 RepID=UPI0010717105|nr:LPXTG cell wall anchor domain-containing protein [Rothia dentocariosa]TFI38719.1 LPXTG cell wall anchor domain-containing protein [Rothia dentocariosa]